MKTLYLVRHAKSEWANEDIIDIDRPLNARGYRDANAMGKKMKDADHVPDLIISSPAVRALTTALIFARKMGMDTAKIRIVPKLYDTGVSDYKKVVSTIEDEYTSAMLFGHNPTISNCANAFVPCVPEGMVTCGIATISSETDTWKSFESKAKFVFYNFPKNPEG